MRRPLRRAIAIEVIILMVGGALFLPGGEDLYRFYLPVAQGCPECGYNPWFTSWILFPIQFIPVRYLWAVWVLFTGVTVYWAAERLQTNSAYVLLAFPMMGQMWLGQTDAVLILGLMLIMLSSNPYLRGAGIVLASIKPHIAGPAILILWWYDKERWKTLIVPTAVFLLSLIVWGIDWPIRWWLSRDLNASLPVWGHAAIFPYGLAAFPAIFLVKDTRQKVAIALLAAALSIPSFGIYSYIVFLVFTSPWWALPLSYAWVVAYPCYGNLALRFAWTLPMGLLIYLLWPVMKENRPKIKAAIFRKDETSTA
ncbi:MAG: hypothetical protein JXB30_19945 [Anaerolineae bacterium]|nr:hypothetical protein [Anaerolineae bacterium]